MQVWIAGVYLPYILRGRQWPLPTTKHTVLFLTVFAILTALGFAVSLGARLAGWKWALVLSQP